MVGSEEKPERRQLAVIGLTSEPNSTGLYFGFMA